MASMQLPTPIASEIHTMGTPLNLLNNQTFYSTTQLIGNDEEILRLRTQNTGILNDLTELAAKYNQTYQGGMRAGRILVQPATER